MMDSESLLDAMEQFRNAVASMTGFKQQYIDAGWSEEMAERMVHAVLLASTTQGAAQ